MMMPILSARWDDTGDYDEVNGQYMGAVVLEFGGWEVTRWPAPQPFEQTNEEYAAEFVAARLAEVFKLLADGSTRDAR